MNKIKFSELALSDDMQRAIADMGFEEASPIQTEAIPHLLEGRDIVGQAQTGTGKTAAFGIPVIEKIDPKVRGVQAIILCPTRELAIQVAEEIKKLSKYKAGIQAVPIYGGQDIERQISAIRRGAHIVIGTPGRVIDHMERGTLKLDNVKMVVLDEADEMLDMGFREDMEFILEQTSEERQTIFFSATMSKPIMDLTKKFLNDPVLVKVAAKELTVTNIDQYYLEIKRGMKTEVLSRLIDMYNLKLMLVFCNTKRMVDELVSDLQARGYSADALHGDLSQNQRNNVMTKFRNGTLEVLVATDVAARGIDVDNVEAVFNYDLPQDPEAYVHRIGRTGRAGRAGKAFSFVIGRDVYTLKDVQRYTKANIKLMPVPSFEDVATIKTNLFLEKVKEVARKGHLTKHIHRIEQLIDEEFTSIDIAAALLKMAVGELKAKEKSQEEMGRKAGPKPGMERLFVTIGKKDKISPKDIVNVIMEEAGLQSKEIGDIELYDRFSFVEIPSELAAGVIRQLGRTQIGGKMVTFDKAQKKDEAQAAEEGFNRPERREKNRRFEPRGGGRSDRRGDRPERRDRRERY